MQVPARHPADRGPAGHIVGTVMIPVPVAAARLGRSDLQYTRLRTNNGERGIGTGPGAGDDRVPDSLATLTSTRVPNHGAPALRPVRRDGG
jgi:hypothetical protein